MSLIIKHQLLQIVSQLAYKAFGFNIKMNLQQIQSLSKNLTSDSIAYKISVPHLIYQQYAKDGFMYSDHGITPKQIADDIIVHYKEQGHLQLESDQFGNIKAYIQKQYFRQKYEKMTALNKIACLDCNELSFHQNQCLKQQKNPQKKLHILMVLFIKQSSKITLPELRQKYVFQSLSKIQSEVFSKTVQHREIFDQEKNHSPTFNKSINDFDEVIFGTLRHQIIQRQSAIQKLLKFSSESERYNIKAIKFGLVTPESINLSYPLNLQQIDQIQKLRRIFYDTQLERPINVEKIEAIDQNFMFKVRKDRLKLPDSIQKLILITQELLSQKKITEIYHFYLILSNFLDNFQEQESKIHNQKNRYKQIAALIRINLKKLLLLV